jgi:hypothetical protein
VLKVLDQEVGLEKFPMEATEDQEPSSCASLTVQLELTMCLHHAHAHAHAIFISTTTKPLPDSATNTDYVTLTLTASTTTPICNLLQPGTDVGLPCPLPASLGTQARMARKIAKFGPQMGDSCNGVGGTHTHKTIETTQQRNNT